MDLAQEEDRISNLPEDIVHHILSFVDLKSAIQLSSVSHKWKHTWITMPMLNLNSHLFRTMPQFARFVKHTLARRDNHSDLSAVDLKFSGAVTQFVVKSVLKYAFSHNVRRLTVTWLSRGCQIFPQHLFSCRSLKHLTLATNGKSFYWYSFSCIPTSPWDFPALETLSLSNMHLGEEEDQVIDLFSKCVNLKDLKLHRVAIHHNIEIFNVCAPKLANLTITEIISYPKIFNICAPRLENLTARVRAIVTTGYLRFPDSQQLPSLEKVNLYLSWVSSVEETDVRALLNLFHKLRSAKFLILDVPIIQTLSSRLDQVSRERCPFDKLECLKINAPLLKPKDPIPTVPPQVRKYLLEKSPRATFIMDLPQVLQGQKRSRQLQVDSESMAKKMAKLEGKIQKKDQVIEQQNASKKEMEQDQQVSESKAKGGTVQEEEAFRSVIRCSLCGLEVTKCRSCRVRRR